MILFLWLFLSIIVFFVVVGGGIVVGEVKILWGELRYVKGEKMLFLLVKSYFYWKVLIYFSGVNVFLWVKVEYMGKESSSFIKFKVVRFFFFWRNKGYFFILYRCDIGFLK